MIDFRREDAEALVERYLSLTGLLDLTTAQKEPIASLVAAQPGSGKSAVAIVVKEELHSNVVPVDADELRETLPPKLFEGLDPIAASQITQKAAGLCVQALRRRVIAERRHFVEEGTYRDAVGSAGFFEGIRNSGYRLELGVLAVHPQRSLLGIFERFENYFAYGVAHPRFVPASYHEETIRGFAQTLIHNANLFDRIRVFNRSSELLADSSRGHSRAEVIGAYAIELRSLTDEQVADIAVGWDRVRAMADRRGALSNPEYMIELVSRHAAAHKLLRERPGAAEIYDSNANALASQLSRMMSLY